MWRIVIISVFFSVCVAETSYDLLWSDNIDLRTESCDNKSQIRCSNDCTKIEVCMEGNTGNLEWMEYGTCDPRYLCEENTVKCKPEGTVNCAAKEVIICNVAGDYPHPHDCTSKVTCKANKESEVTPCPSGFMYSACTGDCDWRYSATECQKAQIKCDGSSVGGLKAVYSNYRMFSQCTTNDGINYNIGFTKCPKGQIISQGICKPYSLPGCGLL